jgi:hypothetical protein
VNSQILVVNMEQKLYNEYYKKSNQNRTRMTLPYERYRSILNTKKFLLDLMNPKKTPRIPKGIRQHACFLLKHYPADYEMEEVAEQSPSLFSKSEIS